MNQGHIIGLVRRDGRPVEGALVGLDWIRGGEGALTIYSTSADSAADRYRSLGRGLSTEIPPPLVNLYTTTTENGAFAMSFQWFDGDLGLASDALTCQIFVNIEERTPTYVISRTQGPHRRARMYIMASFGNAANGLIAPPPADVGSLIGLGTEIYKIIREIRTPMLGFTVAPLSTQLYTLFAGYSIDL